MSAGTEYGPHATSVSARNTVQKAFDDLKSIVSSTDSRNFASTTLQDVRKAARDVERQLAAQQKSSNMRRLEPLFEGLGHYSEVMEVLCNGTPYLPWIWAPIKLVLQVSFDYIEAFRIIMDAYAQIAESLPRFSSLSESLKANAEFQETLAVFYADILRFHEEAYRLIRRSGWKIFFSTTWGRFRRRFEGIISDLNRHAKLVDKEANAYHIHEAHLWRQEARKWRDDSLREIARREKEESVAQFQAVLSWLDIKGAEQDDIFDSYSNETDQYHGTCDWIFKNIKIVSWLRNQPDQPFIWVKGKPGAGKSALLTKIVRFLAQDNQSIVIYHFCSYMHAESTQYGTILKSLIAQILRSNDYLLAHVYEEYLLNRKSSSPQVLEQLLPTLLPAISNESSRTIYVRIVLDGLDECDEDKQQRVFTVLDRMVASTSNSNQTICKVLISSQDSPNLSKLLRRKGSVSLYDERAALMSAIGVYVRQRLERMRDDVFPIEHTDGDVKEIAEAIASNADGMFLWARLVLDVIQVGIFFSAEDMRTSAIKSIPKDLGEFYQRILDRIVTRFGGQSEERMRAVWGWIALAQRPLKKFELKSALIFGSLDIPGAQLPPDHIFELFKPLIEERKDSTLSFIHVSVKNYLQSPASGPFIQQQQVSYEQSLACVACLLSGLNVFQQRYGDNDRLRRVLKGLHGLHLYANEHWIEHLLIAGSHGAGLDTISNLLRLTERLCNDLQLRRTPLPESTLRNGRAPRLDDRLSLLEMHPAIHEYLKFELTYRLQVRLERNGSSTNEGSTTSNSHVSPLNYVLIGFQETVRRLLQMQNFPGASSEDFERFKRDFRTAAYTCRYMGCSRATVGFGDDQARVEHERSHTQMLKCTFPGCKYDLPFRSTNTLKSHMAKYHAPPKATVAPRTLRRSKNHSKLLPERGAASGAISKENQNVAAKSDRYTSSEPVICIVWEQCMGENGLLEWIECGEGWCTAFATMSEDGSRSFNAGIVVEQAEPFDEKFNDDNEEDDILVDSRPLDLSNLRVLPGLTGPFSNPAVSLKWSDQVTGLDLQLEFSTERECRDLWNFIKNAPPRCCHIGRLSNSIPDFEVLDSVGVASIYICRHNFIPHLQVCRRSQDGDTPGSKQGNRQDQYVLLLVQKMTSICERNHRFLDQTRGNIGAAGGTEKETKGVSDGEPSERLEDVRNGTWMRWLPFVLGPLPQIVRLASFTGVPWTKASGFSFLLSWLLIEILILTGRDQSPTNQTHQDASVYFSRGYRSFPSSHGNCLQFSLNSRNTFRLIFDVFFPGVHPLLKAVPRIALVVTLMGESIGIVCMVGLTFSFLGGMYPIIGQNLMLVFPEAPVSGGSGALVPDDEADEVDVAFMFFLHNFLTCVMGYFVFYSSSGTVNPGWTVVFG
ncbi:hypothetical protein G7Y89_g2570 [Cudoniella acicularis]|uniref:NACHT domain-containing protein n=1 Tax=Cudoniella acicularis TaxID=354080 RepID=A0A8H4RV37_9HELO|nr:hypothetical protein G7Y89_g2570 [Cudoniella acicularis]